MRLLVASCVFVLLACETPPPTESWHTVFTGLPGALLSVTGTSDSDVWAVGSDANDGQGPLVLHFDGSAWKRHFTGISGDLWWTQVFADGSVFAGGTTGTVLRFKNGAFTTEATPPETSTVYGVWGVSASDLWAVGGDGESHGFIWHFDGTQWSVPEGLPADLSLKSTIYKVWGASAKDVWFVGSGTRVVHYDGTTFADVTTQLASSERPLFTVSGTAESVTMVGGFASGFLMEKSADGWVDHSPAGVQTLSGVFVRESAGYAVGARGTVVRRTDGRWERETLGIPLREDLHSTWISPSGTVWAVGGRVLQPPLGNGVMIVKGQTISGSRITE
jgi:hypothetical protein